MERKNGQIELTEDEVSYLWEKIYGESPEGIVGPQAAAEAVLMVYGAERIEKELENRG